MGAAVRLSQLRVNLEIRSWGGGTFQVEASWLEVRGSLLGFYLRKLGPDQVPWAPGPRPCSVVCPGRGLLFCGFCSSPLSPGPGEALLGWSRSSQLCPMGHGAGARIH